MLKSKRGLQVFRFAVIALTLVMTIPATSFGKHQGRGRDRGRGFDNRWKCGRFVNCHDARDGRWGKRFRDRRRFDDRARFRRFRQRNLDDADFRRLQRRRYRNYRYQTNPYYNDNGYGYQRNSGWANLLNLFLQ